MALFVVPQSFPSVVNARLTAAGAASADRRAALALLGLLTSCMEPQSYASGAALPELAAQLDLAWQDFARIVGLLCAVGAVAPGRHKQHSRLFLTPPGARQIGPPRQYRPIAPAAVLRTAR